MPRIFRTATLFVAWALAVVIYVCVLYAALDYLHPTPTKDHGPVAAGSTRVEDRVGAAGGTLTAETGHVRAELPCAS